MERKEQKTVTSKSGKVYNISRNGYRYRAYGAMTTDEKQKQLASCRRYIDRLKQSPKGRLKLAEYQLKTAMRRLEKLEKQAQNDNTESDIAPEST